MDLFEEDESEKPKPAPSRPHRTDWIWNLLTILCLLGAIGAAAVAGIIYTNPASSLNPFPEPTMVPTLFIPTHPPLPTLALPTSTATSLPPTSTPLPTQTPTVTLTAIAATPVSSLITATATNTPRSSSSYYSFVLSAEPRAIDANLFNPARGCNWMGVAGQAFDLKNSAVSLGIIVQVGGVVDGKAINVTSLTGTATQYGAAGYEVTLADKPVATKGSVWIRLLDQSALAISDRVFFDTSSNCKENLIYINFKQVK